MSHPFEVFGSQDLHDDDGKVIDSFFIETDAPPDLQQATEPIPATPNTPPIPASRLVSGFQLMDTTFTEPFMLLAADTNRQQLHIEANSTVASPTIADFIMIADEKGKLQLPGDGSIPNSGGMGRLHSGKILCLDVHTGAVWVRPNPTITGTIEIAYWSTTK